MATLSEIKSQIQKHDEEIARLRAQAEKLIAQERSSVIEEVRQKIQEYGLTATDLKLVAREPGNRRATRSAGKAPAKYRNAKGETWTGGRGRKPRWVEEALAAGNSLSEFEIK